jgi:hypothetical protein
MLSRMSPHNRRRGTITPFLLVSLIVLMAALAVAVDYSFLTEARVEMQNDTDAAALAAADVFVDDSTLLNNPAVTQNLVVQAQQQAIAYAALNRVAGQPLVLDPSQGDILFGYIDDPATKIFIPAQNPGGPINAVRIHGRRTQARGNPVGTLATRGFGLLGVDMTTKSTALLDHNVFGFRPNTSAPIPLAPIAILSDPTAVNQQSWEYNVVDGNGPLSASGLFHGITVQMAPTGPPNPTQPNGQVLSIGTSSSAQVFTQLQVGVLPGDLAGFPGSQFALAPLTNQLVVSGPSTPLGPVDYAVLATALTNLQNNGAQRVFPLYSTYDASGNEVTLSGFVAARVVSVQPMNGGQPFAFELQPTVISLPAALTDASRRVSDPAITNPYIVKVRLVE